MSHSLPWQRYGEVSSHLAIIRVVRGQPIHETFRESGEIATEIGVNKA
jgi:hypothetical protein